jgi:hypothetical protein
MVNRRGFLGMLAAGLAGAAIAEQIPFGRVWSFPSKIIVPGNVILPAGSTVRFIRAWSPEFMGSIISRIDVLRGVGDLTPSPRLAHECEYLMSSPNQPLELATAIAAIERATGTLVPHEATHNLASYLAVSEPCEMRGVHWREPLHPHMAIPMGSLEELGIRYK